MLDAGRRRRAPTGAGVASAGGSRPAGVFSRLSSRRQGAQMAYIRIFNPPNVTADVYDRVNAEAGVDRDPPAGPLFHCAREVDRQWQIVDARESQEDARRLDDQRLGPAIRSAMG